MATTNPTDPNKIRLTGENSFIRLSDDASREETTRPATGGYCGLRAALVTSYSCRANSRTMKCRYIQTTSP